MTPKPVFWNIASKFSSQTEKHQHHPGACQIRRISGSMSVLLSENLHFINTPGYLYAHSYLRSPVLEHQTILLLLSIRHHIKIGGKCYSLSIFKGLNYFKVGKCFHYTTLTMHFILTFRKR